MPSPGADPFASHRPGPAVPRRAFLGAAVAGGAALACAEVGSRPGPSPVHRSRGNPTLVGSRNALAGMERFWPDLVSGADPLDVAIQVVKVVEADPSDHSVGLGGLPNEDGVVQLDAAVMHGPTHNSGAVACIENILHPSEVARLVMERTDHCLIVGPGAYRFARQHGHQHVELLTDEAREIWLHWRETMSGEDDRLPAQEPAEGEGGAKTAGRTSAPRLTGTVHCSALSGEGHVGCTTTTSGLFGKVPGRVGDSPIVGAGLYCDEEAGSAGSTGRGEAAILSNGSFAVVELLRQGATPLDAGLEVLRRVTRQVQRAAAWQPGLVDAQGVPSFNVHFYVLGLDGAFAGVSLIDGDSKFAVADVERGPRLEPTVALHPGKA